MHRDPDHHRARPLVFVLGQTQRPTGYARVTRAILARLADRYEVHQFELHDRGEAVAAPWVVHRAATEGDVYGLEAVPPLLDRLRPDLLAIVGDPWVCGMYEAPLRPLRAGMPVVYYAPVEGDDLAPHLVPAIAWVDCLVVYHAHARSVLATAAAAGAGGGAPIRLPPLAVIGHGVDRQTFSPLVLDGAGPDRRASRRQARATLFPDRPDLGEAFVVLNANQNTGRKRLDLTLAGFAQFARGRGDDDAWLYLHAGMRDFGCDVRAEARRLGIADRLLLTHERDGHPQLADERLRLVYNACDVGVNTSTGEGWGLVAFEHAVTCAAQVMPRHGTCHCLWGDAATLLAPVAAARGEYDLFTHRLVAPADLADALVRLRDEEVLERESRKAYARATAPEFAWDAIAQQWDRLFRMLLDSAMHSPRLGATGKVEQQSTTAQSI
jgi:glycosyltransferase involved in cell wall biosynthesis